MVKSKQGPKSKKKGGSSKQVEPETENDFLELADEHERGGGKWKAGDPVKATRFFVRAIDAYNAGLQRFPDSFDLAYNKAHLQYELFQDPRISPHLGPRIEILKETVEAHRYALRLNEENADALFNTAQVLTSYAEELEEADDRPDAVHLLQQAVELFNSCLSRQEMQFYEHQNELADAQIQFDEMAASSRKQGSGHSMETSSTSTEPPQEWALVEDPITADTLLETALAQLSCLSTLISLSIPAASSTLASLSEIATPLIRTKIPSYTSLIPAISTEVETAPTLPTLSISSNNTATFTPSTQNQRPRNPQSEAKDESNIAVANFQAAVAEAEYRSNLSTLETYAVRLRDAFESIFDTSPEGPMRTSYNLSVASSYADALDDLAAAGMKQEDGTSNPSSVQTIYEVLERAKATLADFIPILSDPRSSVGGEPYSQIKRAQILLLNGDICLRLHVIQTAVTQRPGAGAIEFLSEAAKSYSHAAASASIADNDREFGEDGTVPKDVLDEATVRKLIVEALDGSSIGPTSIADKAKRSSVTAQKLQEVVDDMKEQGLLPPTIAGAIEV